MEEYVTKKEFREGINEVLETINYFASSIQGEMSDMKKEMATKQDLAKMELKLIDAMDHKDNRLRGELTVMFRKGAY